MQQYQAIDKINPLAKKQENLILGNHIKQVLTQAA